MADRNDPGFSNQFAVQAGFPSSGEMQQRAGQGGLPPQRQQMPFEHKRAPATNQAVPYVQPVMQGTPAAQGSQYQVRQTQISPGVASFLRANAIDQGARGVEQRLGQIENQMQGMSSPRDAAVGSMAQMRAGRDTQQAPQRAPAAVSQAANMMQAAGPSGAGRAGLPPQMMPGLDLAALTGGMPVVPQQRVADVEQMRRGIAPAVAPIQPGVAPIGAQMPDVGMMNAMFPQGPAPRSIEDRRAFFGKGSKADEELPGLQVGSMAAPTSLKPLPGRSEGGAGQERGAEVTPPQAPSETRDPMLSQFGSFDQQVARGSAAEPFPAGSRTPADPQEQLFQKPLFNPGFGAETFAGGDKDMPSEDPAAELTSTSETWQTPGSEQPDVHLSNAEVITKDLFSITDKLENLGDKVSKGIIEDAKQQVQKQKDYLHAALSEAGGGILAGGSPLLAQESISATKAIISAQHQAAKAEAAILTAQAGILSNLLGQENKMELADAALQWAKDRHKADREFQSWTFNEQLDWAKDKFGKQMDWTTSQGKTKAIIAAMEVLMKGGYEAEEETIMGLAKAIASGKELTEEDFKKYFKPAPKEPEYLPADGTIYTPGKKLPPEESGLPSPG